MHRLSVVIATRDRPRLLADCLGTLARQEPDARQLEVIVVDDGSATDLARVVAPFDTAFELRFERRRSLGLSHARNTGARLARAPLVAYLDDDVLVDPGWAAAVLRSHDALGWKAMAGRIRLAFEAPAPAWLGHGLRSLLAELDLGDEVRLLEPGESGVGANCAFDRHALLELGGFSTDLGRGAPFLVNEEVRMFQRVREQGWPTAYVPDAAVDHRVPAARLTSAWFVHRSYEQGVGDAAVAPDGVSSVREVVRLLRMAPIAAKGLVTGKGLVSARAWAAYCRGRWDGRQRRLAAEPSRTDA